MKLHGGPNLARGPEFDTHGLNDPVTDDNDDNNEDNGNIKITGWLKKNSIGLYFCTYGPSHRYCTLAM